MGSDYCQIAAKLCNGKFNNHDSPRDKTLHVNWPLAWNKRIFLPKWSCYIFATQRLLVNTSLLVYVYYIVLGYRLEQSIMLKQEKVEVYCDDINLKPGYFVLLVKN